LPLHTVPPCARQDSEGVWESQSTTAAASRRATADSGRHLCRPTVSSRIVAYGWAPWPHRTAAPWTLRLGRASDIARLRQFQCPRRRGDQPKRKPPPDNRWRHMAHGSRLTNRGDLLGLAQHTNASGASWFSAPHRHSALKSHPRPPLQLESHFRPPAILVISVDRHQYRHRGAHLHHRLDIFPDHGLSRPVKFSGPQDRQQPPVNLRQPDGTAP
jgi:hypothetical protein